MWNSFLLIYIIWIFICCSWMLPMEHLRCTHVGSKKEIFVLFLGGGASNSSMVETVLPSSFLTCSTQWRTLDQVFSFFWAHLDFVRFFLQGGLGLLVLMGGGSTYQPSWDLPVWLHPHLCAKMAHVVSYAKQHILCVPPKRLCLPCICGFNGWYVRLFLSTNTTNNLYADGCHKSKRGVFFPFPNKT